jgi:hypothetical protein
MLPVGGVESNGNFFPHQSDTKAWDDDYVGSMSQITFFSPVCLITWSPLIRVMHFFQLG